MEIVRQNNKGFTLIEVLISIAILIISMFATLNALVVSVQQNINNIMMDEAVNIAEGKMNEWRNVPFTSLSTGTFTETVQRRFRNLDPFAFTIESRLTSLSTNSMAIQVIVKWTAKGTQTGMQHSHSISSVITRET